MVPLAHVQEREHCQRKAAASLEQLRSEWMEKEVKRKKGRLLMSQHLKQTKQVLF